MVQHRYHHVLGRIHVKMAVPLLACEPWLLKHAKYFRFVAPLSSSFLTVHAPLPPAPVPTHPSLSPSPPAAPLAPPPAPCASSSREQTTLETDSMDDSQLLSSLSESSSSAPPLAALLGALPPPLLVPLAVASGLIHVSCSMSTSGKNRRKHAAAAFWVSVLPHILEPFVLKLSRRTDSPVFSPGARTLHPHPSTGDPAPAESYQTMPPPAPLPLPLPTPPSVRGLFLPPGDEAEEEGEEEDEEEDGMRSLAAGGIVGRRSQRSPTTGTDAPMSTPMDDLISLAVFSRSSHPDTTTR